MCIAELADRLAQHCVPTSGVYQKDPDRCIDALVAMGVLVPGGDRTAVRRTAEFFLTSFQACALCPWPLLGMAPEGGGVGGMAD